MPIVGRRCRHRDGAASGKFVSNKRCRRNCAPSGVSKRNIEPHSIVGFLRYEQCADHVLDHPRLARSLEQRARRRDQGGVCVAFGVGRVPHVREGLARRRRPDEIEFG